MKKLVVSFLAVVLLAACGLIYSDRVGAEKSSSPMKKITAQGCIGVPPECLGGGE